MKSLLKLDKLQKKIGYSFKDLTLLQQALTHRSANKIHNERLEFLGDAILSLIIAEDLYERFPNVSEGDLSQMRSTLVCATALGEIGKAFNLGDYLILGQGELKSGGFRRESIISDAVEAIIGAIYQDTNIDVVTKLVLAWYEVQLESIRPGEKQKDSKTRLQEYLQGQHKERPSYLIVEVKGNDHEQEFVVMCRLDSEKQEFLGSGSSRRKAEQAAAETAIIELGIK